MALKLIHLVVCLTSAIAINLACSEAFQGFERDRTLGVVDGGAPVDSAASRSPVHRAADATGVSSPPEHYEPNDAAASPSPSPSTPTAPSAPEPSSVGEGCVPQTCASSQTECGIASDGCGGTLDCGDCELPQTCGGSGERNRCGCTPQTCSSLAAECGIISDGCGAVVDCGACTAPERCGLEAPNICSCRPTTCAAQQAECGTISDGCGGTLTCGSCGLGALCGLSVANRCGLLPCVPTSCSEVGATCGPLSDGCGATLDCGKCAKDFECTDQQCVCKAGKTCNSGSGDDDDEEDD
jgi:hypothetical protein